MIAERQVHNLQRLSKRLRRQLLGARDCRGELLERMPKGGVCAEVGVWQGEFSARILESTRPRMLHLIDPWSFQPDFPDRYYGGKLAGSQRDMDRVYEGVRRRLGSRRDVSIHRQLSEVALECFPDEYFDWVYIDGNHSYDFVRADLELALQKVRSKGFIVGDDYAWGEWEDFPVMRAVNELFDSRAVARAPEIIGNQFVLVKH